MALLLPDPCDPHCPEAFRREARRSLPKFIADFASTIPWACRLLKKMASEGVLPRAEPPEGARHKRSA